MPSVVVSSQQFFNTVLCFEIITWHMRFNCHYILQSSPRDIHVYIHFAAFTLIHQKFDLYFHRLFRNWALPLTLNISQLFINFNNWWQFWNPHDEQITNLSLIFKINEEITEKIGNEKDETKLIFEKYQLSLTSNISAKISSNWACRGCFGIVTTSRF